MAFWLVVSTFSTHPENYESKWIHLPQIEVKWPSKSLGIILVTFSDDERLGWTLAHRNEKHRSFWFHASPFSGGEPGSLGNGLAWRYFTLLTKVITPFITGSVAHLAGFLRPKFVHGSVHYQRPAFQHAAVSAFANRVLPKKFCSGYLG